MNSKKPVLSLEPANEYFQGWKAKNCIVIPEPFTFKASEVTDFGMRNDAYIDFGCGFWQYVVRFGDGQQDSFFYHDIRSELSRRNSTT